jgi:predicted DNA-binding transcriptional regulator YafY
LAGIPIVTSPGVNGGIGIMEEYKIEKKLFTISDVTSLLMGLGSLHSTMTSEGILNTTSKIKCLIPQDQIINIELKSNQIVIDHTPWIGNRKLNVNLDEIRTALYENRLISFKYSAQNGKKVKGKLNLID